MGLFGEIQRAWITVDNRLYLWNYANGQDFQAYEDHSHTITCVKLVRPRPGVFVDGITHLLVIATLYEIFLLGVAAPKANSGELQFYGTRMSVPATGIDVSSIESTASGRIFFAGKVDTHIYELLYQAEEGWFSRRCSKINRTGSTLDTFIPSVLSTKTTEFVTQITIDNSRNILYSLSSKSTIRAYSIDEPASLRHSVTYTYPSAASHAQMVNAASQLIDPRTTSIVSITALSTSESKQIYLVAVNSAGCRLYLRSSSTSFYTTQGSSMSALQVSHVRYPPVSTQNAAPSNNLPTSLVQTKQPQLHDSTSQVLSPTVHARIFTPGLFLNIKRNNGSEPGDTLFAAAPELNKIALQFQGGNQRPLLSESCCWVPIEGFVQDICRIGSTGIASVGMGSELTTQYTSQPATFAVLTNTGVHLVRRRRTVEVFASALRHAPATNGGIEGEMRKFFENIGRAEGCATCLGVICGSLDGSDVDTEALRSFNTAYGSTLSPQEIQDTSRKYFIEFGGKAFVDENQNRAFAQDGSATIPTLDMVRLSGRHDGIALYVSRLIGSFWKVPIIRQVSGAPARAVDYISSLPATTLSNIQSKLVALEQFLDTNKNFIEGLNGPDRLLSAVNRAEEIVLQAEHRGMHALVVLVKQVIEGLSFVSILSDSPDQKMTDLVLSISPQNRQQITQITLEELIVADKGRDIAKELITAVVNRRIAQGGTVESVSETLQKRCGTFCSADDVILYKAIEKLKRAKECTTVSERDIILRDCLRLFQHASATLSLENLKDTMDEFVSMQFYSGALDIAFSVARASDPQDTALSYLSEGKPEGDSRQARFAHREKCYSNIFEALDKLEQAYASQEAAYAGSPNTSPLSAIRDAAYNVISQSNDELFHNVFYDWYESRGLRDRLLEVQSPYIQPYLERKATQSIELADLFWQYLARHGSYWEAAQVLYNLSRSDFKLSLESRIEYLSQANNFCSCVTGQQQGPHVISLQQNLTEELDVASIQDDILNEIKVDDRLSDQKKADLIARLDGKLIPLTDLFNSYADPLSYGVVCLAIFQSADYRGTAEIRNCWEKLIAREHEKAEALEGTAPYESVSLLLKTLGRRFSVYQPVFPVEDLLPMVERYNLSKQRKSPRGWVIDAFLEAGVNHDVMFTILDDMLEQPTWQGKTATSVLVGETLYLCTSWYELALRPSLLQPSSEFNKQAVLYTLQRFTKILNQQAAVDLRIEVETLEKRIKSGY